MRTAIRRWGVLFVPLPSIYRLYMCCRLPVDCQWLRANGATFPKIEWPSRGTVGGVRGAVALDDIATDEKMLCIPISLMITPPLCRASPELAPVYEHSSMLFADNDMVRAIV